MTGEKVIYSGVEGDDLDIDDLINFPESFLVIGLDTTIICNVCHKHFTIKKTIKSVSMRCGCGCRLFYPKNDHGAVITTFISKEEYSPRGASNGRREITSRPDD